jgi:hypothetical protein
VGLLEKLRPQPRWKHTDPSVRAAAVYELGPDEAEALHALAREDADGRVRRAAVTRIDDIAVLTEVARTDPDEDVRGDAIRGLAGVAAEASDPSRALEAVAQLQSLGRTREVVFVARDSASPEIRAAVVDLVSDAKSLGAISRHAPDGATRLRALERLTDQDEILNVALKCEHTDAAVAALEKISDDRSLDAIGQRARNKVAARRAKVRVRQLEEASKPAAAEVAAAMSAADRARAMTLLHQAEALVALPDPAVASASLAETRLAWAELQADVEVDPQLGQQFDAASEAVREAIAEREREREAEQARLGALLQEQADRLEICSELERLEGPASLDRIAELKVRWDGLPPMPSEYAASLTRRMQHACRNFEDRERRRTLAEAAGGRLETLATELEQLLGSEQPLDELLARWRGLRRDADVLREHAAANPSAAERLERAVAAIEKEQQHQQVRAKQEQDNLRRLQQLARQVETLVTTEPLTLKAGDRALRDIKTAIDERAPLPSKKDRQEIQARLEVARTALGPRVQELRDADEWQRWANLQVQEELCKEMEALKAEANLDTAARKMRELQGRWKAVALAPRAQGETMWRRFKTAQDEVFTRTSAHLAQQNEERIANLAKKQALCARADALADSTDWVKTATEIQGLQAEWKTIGPVSRGHEKQIWERFRAACDRFFTRRQEDLKKRKDDWSANLARKEALCAQAEALADSTEWEKAAGEVKRLQAEWKTIGPVRRSKSEVIWQRFRTACDRFFERYKHRDQVDLVAKAAPREAIIRELEALLPAAGAEAVAMPDDLPALVRDARARWQTAPEVPRHIQLELAARYHQALGKLVAAQPAAFAGSDLDPEATQKRMEKLIARVEELSAPQAGSAEQSTADMSPAERLAHQWRERLAANTMGGKTTESEESKWRAAEQEIRSVQSQWMRLGPVPPAVAGPLNDRFQRACRRFYDQRKRAS